MRPSIVIIGSAKPGREYTPPLKDSARIAEACEAIGRELALAGCDLVVFSSSDDYIEKDTVRGYLEAVQAGNLGSVVVHAPYDREVDFGAPGHLRNVVKVRPDPATEWEVSYYRAILEADGLVVVGGGRSGRIAGVLALTRRVPVVALATFGGGALAVWQYLDRHRNYATDDDLHLMARSWTDESAGGIVRSLLRQLAARDEALRQQERAKSRAVRSRTLHGLAGGVGIALAALTIWLGFGAQSVSAAVAYLLAGPLFAAIGGALVRDAAAEEPNIAWSAARGLGAGVLAATLYVGSQQLTNAEELTAEGARRLAWFLVPIGLAAGYTVDLVYAKLRRADALADQPFQQP